MDPNPTLCSLHKYNASCFTPDSEPEADFLQTTKIFDSNNSAVSYLSEVQLDMLIMSDFFCKISVCVFLRRHQSKNYVHSERCSLALSQLSVCFWVKSLKYPMTIFSYIGNQGDKRTGARDLRLELRLAHHRRRSKVKKISVLAHAQAVTLAHSIPLLNSL